MKLFKDFSIRKMLMNRKIAIALSLFVSFFFWLIIAINQTPERERTLSKVQIEVNTDDILGNKNLKVVGDISQTASVKVNGPNYLVSSLTSDDIYVEADVSKVNGANEYELSLVAVKKDSQAGYNIVSTSPSTINVKLDYYEKKPVKAVAVIEGYGKINNDYLYDSVFTSNNSPYLNIDVEGFRTDLSKLDSIEVKATTDDVISETKIFGESEIVLLDTDGKQLEKDKYKLSVNTATIALTVSKEKTFSAAPQYAGAVNSSINSALMGCWSTDTKTLTLKGPPDVIDSITKLEYENPIDLSTLSPVGGTIKSYELTPKLSDGVTISDATKTVTFKFDLSSFTTKVFTISSFDHEGTLPSGLTASCKNEYSVTVCGKKNIINRLDSKNLYLFIDLSEIKGDDVGTKTITGQLKTRHNDAVWMIGNCDVSVKIQ